MIGKMEVFAQPNWIEMIPRLKRTVVNIKVSNSRYFEVGQAGIFNGTGFVVDKKRGLVVTNRHVATEYASQIEITFLDGSSLLAKLVYWDPAHDFSILQYDASRLGAETKTGEVILGDFSSLKVGDPVLMIGNNESEEFSVKEGKVIDLSKNKGDIHSLTFQTSFDRTGGSSGSPVWNQKGEVVGIHFKGTNTSSFELPINYVNDQLERVRKGDVALRGEIGLQLDLLKLEDAKKYFKFPKEIAKDLKKLNPSLRNVVYIKSVIPRFSIEGVFQSGDIIVSVNGQKVYENLYLFDRIVDKSVGNSVNVEIYRRGIKKQIDTKVLDAEKYKIREFLLFGGGTFHNITPRLRFYYDIGIEGVFMSQADKGSSMDQIGASQKKVKDRKVVVVTAVDGQRVKNLDDLFKITKKLKNRDHLTITFKDYYYSGPPKIEAVTLSLERTPTTFFEFDSKKNEWVRK